MMSIGEAIVYLRGEAERELHEVETNIKLLKKPQTLSTLAELKRNLYNISRDLRSNRALPSKIPAGLQACSEEVEYLRSEVATKLVSTLSAAQAAAVGKAITARIEKIEKKLAMVTSLLVSFEKENSRRDNARVR